MFRYRGISFSRVATTYIIDDKLPLARALCFKSKLNVKEYIDFVLDQKYPTI